MMAFLRRLFGGASDAPPMPRRPFRPRPADWKFTMSDLMEEMKAGKRKSVGPPEIEWARDYERSLIPEGTRFPRKGDVYESLEDQKVGFITLWAAPYSGGGEAVLFKGERVWIQSESAGEKPIGTYALPVDYKAVEARMVPAEERQSPKYGGFSLHLSTMDLAKHFRLVETGWRA